MMKLNITEDAKNIITSEFDYAVEKMRSEPNPLKKLFFYSATYGVLPRIFNIEYDPMLIHMHLILQTSFGTINHKVQEIVRGVEQVIEIPSQFFEKLEDTLERMSEKINKNEEFYDDLVAITNLTYAFVGNGQYLYQKGILEL